MSKTIFCMAPLRYWSRVCVCAWSCVCARVHACACVSVLVWTLNDCDCISIGFSPRREGKQGQTRRNGIRGGNSSPLPRHSPFLTHTQIHTLTHSHKYIEWCLLLLGVLALLMRCERGTEMKQVKKGKRGGSGKQSEREGEE